MAESSTLHRVWLLVAVSALAGLLLAGIMLPVVGGLGLAARTGVNDFENLPSSLTIPPLPQVSRILAADGSTLATFYYEDRIPVTLAQIPAVMRKAIVAIEDARFYEHHGIDIKGTLRALVTNGSAGSIRQGGSTLTQQYVKNVLIESAQSAQAQQAAHAPTLARKIREARYALALEHRFSKDEILERYLNIAYFGDGAYGVGSAALHYFGIPVQRLDLAQAATLAGLVQDPYAYNPALHPRAGRDRRDTVLRRMAQLRFVSQADADAAMTEPLKLHLKHQDNGCEGTAAPFFCDYVLADIKQDPALGATPGDRTRLLLRGGLTITTTLDRNVQKAAQHAVDSEVGRASRYGAAVAVVQPGTGAIEALAENRTYGSGKGQTRVDYAVDYDHGGSSGFQAGSTFKVFTLTAALQEGIPLSLHLSAPPQITLGSFTNCVTGIPFPPYTVHNAEPSEGGYFDIPHATWESVNTFYVQLEQKAGLCTPADIAHAMGVTRADGKPLLKVPAFTLGVNEVSPLDMADAMATLAAHGSHCAPVSIRKVVDAQGHVLPLNPQPCEQVMDPALADTVTSVLHGVIDGKDPFRTGIKASIGRPAAGKTGTIEGFSDAWFVGYTPDLAAAVALGDPRGGQSHPLLGVTFNGVYYAHVFGGDVPAMIWRDTMRDALANVPPHDFTAAGSKYTNGLKVTIPDVAGLAPAQAVKQLDQAHLTAVLDPNAVDSTQTAGSVAYTTPGAGSQVSPGTTVTVFVSNGTPPPPPPPPSPSPSPLIEKSTAPPPPSPTPKRRHH